MSNYNLKNIFEGFINRQKTSTYNETDLNIKNIYRLKKTTDIKNLIDQFRKLFDDIPFFKNRTRIIFRDNFITIYFKITKFFYGAMNIYQQENGSFIFYDSKFIFSYVEKFTMAFSTEFANKNIFSNDIFYDFIAWAVKLISKDKNNYIFNHLTEELNKEFTKIFINKKHHKNISDEYKFIKKYKITALLNLINAVSFYILKSFNYMEMMPDKLGNFKNNDDKIAREFIKKFTDINPDLLNEGFINKQKAEDSINPTEKNIFYGTSGNSGDIVLKKTNDLNNLANQLENIFKYIPVLKDRIKINRSNIKYFLELDFYVNKHSFIKMELLTLYNEDTISFVNFDFKFSNNIDNYTYSIAPFDKKDIFSKGVFSQFIYWLIKLSENKNNQLFDKFTDELDKIYSNNKENISKFLHNEKCIDEDINIYNFKYDIIYYYLKTLYKNLIKTNTDLAENTKVCKDFLMKFMGIDINLLNEGFINKQKAENTINPTEKNVFSDTSKKITLERTDDLNNLADQLENIFEYIPFLKNKIYINKNEISRDLLFLDININKNFYIATEFSKKGNKLYFDFFVIWIQNNNDDDASDYSYYINTIFDYKNIFLKGLFNQYINWLLKLMSENKKIQLHNNELYKTIFFKYKPEKILKFLQNKKSEDDDLKFTVTFYFFKILYKDLFSMVDLGNDPDEPRDLKRTKEFLKEFGIDIDLLNEGFINSQKSEDTINLIEKQS